MTTATDAYASLRRFGALVVTNAEAAALWRQDESATTHTLLRLEHAGLVQRVRHGVWAIEKISDPLIVGPVLTRPYPSYGSSWTALARYGMIEQIPRSIQLVSTARPRVVATVVGTFVIHQVHPDLFGGFAVRDGIALATPEKALFDTVYLLAARSAAHVSLPEITWPEGFDREAALEWAERIPSRRLRGVVEPTFRRVLKPVVGGPGAGRGVGRDSDGLRRRRPPTL